MKKWLAGVEIEKKSDLFACGVISWLQLWVSLDVKTYQVISSA